MESAVCSYSLRSAKDELVAGRHPLELSLANVSHNCIHFPSNSLSLFAASGKGGGSEDGDTAGYHGEKCASQDADREKHGLKGQLAMQHSIELYVLDVSCLFRSSEYLRWRVQ